MIIDDKKSARGRLSGVRVKHADKAFSQEQGKTAAGKNKEGWEKDSLRHSALCAFQTDQQGYASPWGTRMYQSHSAATRRGLILMRAPRRSKHWGSHFHYLEICGNLQRTAVVEFRLVGAADFRLL